MTYDVVIYDIIGPRISEVHDVVGLTDIVGPYLRCCIFFLYVMSSVLTYDVECFVHHVAHDIAYNV